MTTVAFFPYSGNKTTKELCLQSSIITIKEIAYTATWTVLTSFFMLSSPIGLITFNISIIAANALLHLRASFFAKKADLATTVVAKEAFSSSISKIEHFCSDLLALFDSATKELFLREGARATTALLLYKKALPQMYLFPAKNKGYTSFCADTLSRLGELFGSNGSFICFISSGIVISIIVGVGSLLASHMLKHSYPRVALYCKKVSICSTMNNIFFSLASFFKVSPPSSDFTILWKRARIHPLICTVTFIALPLLIEGYYWFFADKKRTG